jgi:hypothetical protein
MPRYAAIGIGGNAGHYNEASPLQGTCRSQAAEERRMLLMMAPIPRLADTLDRAREQRIRGVECRLRDGGNRPVSVIEARD